MSCSLRLHGGEMDNVKVEQIVLPDGRRAERHSFVDAEGKEVVEIFAEEKKPLQLEKRISREKKEYLAREVEETVQNGTVVEQKVVEHQEPKLEVTKHIGLAEHAKVLDGEYLRKDEASSMIADGVVAAVSALIDARRDLIQPAPIAEEPAHEPYQRVLPKVSAQAVVEQNVEDKKKNQLWLDVGLVALIVAQVGFFVYYVSAVMQ